MQIVSALSADAVVMANVKTTALESATRREDGYGNMVRDRAVLELTQRKPRAELYSVIPKGTPTNHPHAEKKRPLESGLKNIGTLAQVTYNIRRTSAPNKTLHRY